MTYKIADYRTMVNNLDYTYDLKTSKHLYDNSKKIAQRLINIAQVHTKKHVEHMELKMAIKSSEKLAQCITEELYENEEIKNLGIQIMGFSVLSVQPNKETARALEAQAREQILKSADDALYERRNASIEQERRIKENELNTEIAIEEKKKKIKEAQLEAERLVMQKENQMKDEQLGYETDLEQKRKQLIELTVANAKEQADSKAYELTAMMKAFSGVDQNVMQALSSMGMKPDKLIAMAFHDLAENAEKIGQLNITPDLLQGILQENSGK